MESRSGFLKGDIGACHRTSTRAYHRHGMYISEAFVHGGRGGNGGLTRTTRHDHASHLIMTISITFENPTIRGALMKGWQAAPNADEGVIHDWTPSFIISKIFSRVH